MSDSVIVTCALTGLSEPVAHRPKTPLEIATAAIDAAKAGAAIVHIHVRDPQTGAASRSLDLFRDVVDRIRAADVDVLINLTTGVGMSIVLADDDPTHAGPGSGIIPALERLAHVEELLPDLCTLDYGVFPGGEQAVDVTTTEMARKMAVRMRELGVKPEMEIFELGNIELCRGLIQEDLIDDPPYFQLCLGVPGSALATTEVMKVMRDLLPSGAVWSAFGISRHEMPMVAQAALLGGNVRVGLEDNLWLTKGVPATNAQLVEKAVGIIEALGARAASPDEARARLGLGSRASLRAGR